MTSHSNNQGFLKGAVVGGLVALAGVGIVTGQNKRGEAEKPNASSNSDKLNSSSGDGLGALTPPKLFNSGETTEPAARAEKINTLPLQKWTENLNLDSSVYSLKLVGANGEKKIIGNLRWSEHRLEVMLPQATEGMTMKEQAAYATSLPGGWRVATGGEVKAFTKGIIDDGNLNKATEYTLLILESRGLATDTGGWVMVEDRAASYIQPVYSRIEATNNPNLPPALLIREQQESAHVTTVPSGPPSAKQFGTRKRAELNTQQSAEPPRDHEEHGSSDKGSTRSYVERLLDEIAIEQAMRSAGFSEEEIKRSGKKEIESSEREGKARESDTSRKSNK
jgi:hypothetical protein